MARIDTLPRIGGIATMPSRTHTFATVLESILPQLDRLFIYFDKFAAVPRAYVGHPKIEPLLPGPHGDLASGGKFLGLLLQPDPCLYFCFDDDIRYPPGYVEVLARALHRHFMHAAVGLHGSFFRAPYLSYRDHRAILNFADPLDADVGVDTLGTGTVAFHAGNFRFDPRQWSFPQVNDLMFAIEAMKQQLPRICIRRPKDYLRPLEEDQADSVRRQLLADDRRESEIMRAALATYPLAWHRWGFEPPS